MKKEIIVVGDELIGLGGVVLETWKRPKLASFVELVLVFGYDFCV